MISSTSPAVWRSEASTASPSEASSRAVRTNPEPMALISPVTIAGTPSRNAISLATSEVIGVSRGRSIRTSASVTNAGSMTRTTGDCDRSTRNASVAARPSVSSEDSNSDTMTGERSSSTPRATRLPAGPMPAWRMINHATVSAARKRKASAPPPSALRQLNSRRVPEEAIGLTSVTLTAECEVVSATDASSSSSRAARSEATPSCTKAVAITIGSPMMSRTSANGSTQSGKPTESASCATTCRATHDPAR